MFLNHFFMNILVEDKINLMNVFKTMNIKITGIYN